MLLIPGQAAAEPLIFDHGRLFIAAEINGVATEGLLDSGAEASLIDDDLARVANFPAGRGTTIRGSGGEQQAELVRGVTIDSLGVELKPDIVVVMDLADLSERLIKRPTRAVVGRELFDSGRLRIDIRGRAIDRMDTSSEPPGRRLQLIPHAGIESIPVILNGRAALAEFDLGNGSQVMVSRALAEELRLKATGRTAGGGIGGALVRDTATLDRLEVAGIVFRDVPAVIDDQPNANDLNIGTSILRHFLITTDFRDKAVWLQPVGGDE